MSTTDVVNIARARRTIRDTPAVARDLRRQSGLSLYEVGAALGVSHAAVWRYETGQRIPRGDVAVRYLDLLRRAAGVE